MKRNSSIELLRILAMFMITIHHYFMYENIELYSFGVNKVLAETFFYSGGKIGVVIFFLISAWYLPVEGSIRSSLRRIWMLEREVLFWSFSLLIFFLFLYKKITLNLIVSSIFPVLTNLWWYITAYVVFLLFFPFFVRGLRVLGKKNHLILCCISLLLWSIGEGFFPFFSLGMSGGDFLSFVYIYILMSFYRWYMPLIKKETAWKIVAITYVVLLLQAVIGGFVYKYTGDFARLQVYLSGTEYKICPLLIGFGFFSLFIESEFHSTIINRVASSTLAVYLITAYPLVHNRLWSFFSLNSMWNTWYVLPLACGIVILIMLLIFVIDTVRQILFHYTFDRHRGKFFNYTYDKISSVLKNMYAYLR